MGVMLGPSILPGNHVTDLENGAEIFPAMLEAIRGAQHTITFETYIYWEGEVGQWFADALSERARAGVTRSEEHTSELQSLMRISYAVFCLKKKTQHYNGITDQNLPLESAYGGNTHQHIGIRLLVNNHH